MDAPFAGIIWAVLISLKVLWQDWKLVDQDKRIADLERRGK